jgi:O-antigen/teichoic acid export membrane protein
MGNTKSQVFSGVFWTIAERFSASGVSFVVSIVLARVLMPSDYGLVAMVMIFITLADVFINSGFNTALVQKKDADEVDFSTVFWCSFAVSLVLYALLFFVSPLIASFYGEPALILLLRVFAVRIPLAVPNSIQHAYVQRHMIFKKFFFSTLISTIASGVMGIAMALMGFGPYALIGQYFTKTIFDTLVLAFIIEWRPRFLFSWSAAKHLMAFGSSVLFADLSGTFFDQLRGLIIGRFYTSSDLAYYNRGQQFPQFISSNVSSAIMTVLFPAIADVADDMERVRAMTRRALKTMAFVFFPLMIGLACTAKPLIELLLTDKWDGSVVYLQILSVSAAIEFWSSVSLQSLKAIGRGGTLVKLEIVKKPVYVLLLAVGVRISVEAIALTMLLYSVYGAIVNMRELRKHTGYAARRQFLDVVPEGALSLAMGCCVYAVNFLPASNLVKLLLQIAVGVVVYGGVARATHMESWDYAAGIVRDIRKDTGRSDAE